MSLSVVQFFVNIKRTIIFIVPVIILCSANASFADDGLVDSMAAAASIEVNKGKGTPSDDIIYGTEGDDRIDGKKGNDTIYGLAGDDKLTGGSGDDWLEAGAGNDTLNGGTGNDIASYASEVTEYTYEKVGSNWFVTSSLGEIDRLQKIVELHFADRIIYLDGRNNAPITVEDQLTVNEDDIVAVLLNVISNDRDFDGDFLTLQSVNTTNTQGLAAIETSVIGSISYSPNGQFESLSQGETLQDTLTYEVSDGSGGSAVGIVTVSVLGANDAPTVSNVTVRTDEGVSVSARFLADDIDGDDNTRSLAFSIVRNPDVGVVLLGSGGQFTYDPGDSLNHLKAGEQHDVTFEYVVTDRHNAISQAATATITVYGLSNLPAPTIELCSPTIFSKVNGQIQVTDTSSIRVSNIASTTLASGDMVVVWGARHPDDTPFTADEVYGQIYNSQGIKQGSIFRINTYFLGGQKRPDITALSDGGFVVVWQSDQENGTLGVYAQRFDALGAKVTGEVHVNTYTESGQYDVNVGSLTGGGHVVVWTSPSTDGIDLYKNVYGQIFDDDGMPIGDELLINSHIPNHQHLASVAGLENGGFVAAWKSDRQDSYHSISVFAQIFDRLGTKVGDEFKVNTYSRSGQTLPDIIAIDGGFIVTWASFQDGSSYGIYQQRFDLNGKPIGLEAQVNTITKNTQTEPSIVMLTDGGYVITWRGSNVLTGYANRISGQRFDQFGHRVGDEFLADLRDSDATLYNFRHDVTSTADGGFFVSWSRFNDEDSLYQVLAQAFGPTKLNVLPAGDLPLNITVGHEQQSTVVELSVVISGLPTGSIVSAGHLNSNGDWLLDAESLDGLTFSITSGFTGELNLTITVIATHKDTGETSSTSQPLSLNF